MPQTCQIAQHLAYTTLFRSSLLQAISFHHGEIHYPNNQINSIQKMTSNKLYTITDHNKNLHTFQKPSTAFEKQMEIRSEEHMSELQSRGQLVCRLLLDKKHS